MTPYQIFWSLLIPCLISAETKNPGPMKLPQAIQRLKKIEGEGQPDNAGQTAYLGSNDPYKALADYISYTYHGAKAPDWLIYAERGY
jgi:hypothetical protein